MNDTNKIRQQVGAKRKATPNKPFKNSFAVEVPNPDFSDLLIGDDHSVLADLYSEEYLEYLPKVDHTPKSYEAMIEEEKQRSTYTGDEIKHIYVWVAQLSGLIKIGYSKNWHRRLSQTRSTSGEAIFEYCLLDGSPQVEQEIHSELGPFRHHGEWYYPTPQVLTWLHEAEGYGGY